MDDDFSADFWETLFANTTPTPPLTAAAPPPASPQPPPPPQQPPPPPVTSDEWSFDENKIFENSLAELDLNSPDLFEKIALRVPGKTVAQIHQHYNALLEDIEMIESGAVPLPNYKDSTSSKRDRKKKSVHAVKHNSTNSRRKGVTWTENEHQLFLKGLEKYGKGDWRSISRYFVVTRTPSQVASHAQKYFLKLHRSSQNADSEVNHSSVHVTIGSVVINTVDDDDHEPPAAASVAEQQPAITATQAVAQPPAVTTAFPPDHYNHQLN